MHLRTNETVIRVYRHHYFPYLIRVIKIILGSLPFFMMVYLFSPLLTMSQLSIIYISLIMLFSFVLIYASLIYWLDHLIITNQRVAFIDWKQLMLKEEVESSLKEIQDISSEEKGILSFLPLLDYGFVRIQTASHVTAIEFSEAPDPDGIKDFIYNIRAQALIDENDRTT